MPKPWSVYMVECADKTLYTGITNDMDSRIEAHNSGKGAAYTKGRAPVKVLYCEPCGTRSVAAKREAEIKRFERQKKLKLIDSVL